MLLFLSDCLPELINLGHLSMEASPFRILLVFDLNPANSANTSLLKWQEVLRLWFLVDIFNHYIDRLPRIALLEVNIPHEVDIAEVLRWFEGMREDVS